MMDRFVLVCLFGLLVVASRSSVHGAECEVSETGDVNGVTLASGQASQIVKTISDTHACRSSVTVTMTSGGHVESAEVVVAGNRHYFFDLNDDGTAKVGSVTITSFDDVWTSGPVEVTVKDRTNGWRLELECDTDDDYDLRVEYCTHVTGDDPRVTFRGDGGASIFSGTCC